MSAFSDAMTRLGAGQPNGYNNADRGSGNPLGFGNGGHRVNFFPALADFVLVASTTTTLVAPIVDLEDEIAALGAMTADISAVASMGASVPIVASNINSINTIAANMAAFLVDYNVAIVSAAGPAYLVTTDDLGKIKELTHNATITVTLPNSMPKGFTVSMIQGGDGQLSFAPAAGASIKQVDGLTKTRKVDAFVTLMVRNNVGGAAAVWHVLGDMGI